MSGKLIEPKRDQILRFCAEDPVERVFLEDVARRGLGRFVGLADGRGLLALCHVGVNAVPSGRGCGAFAREVVRVAPRMLIGEAGAVSELWNDARSRLPRPREDRPGQPVFVLRGTPSADPTGLRAPDGAAGGDARRSRAPRSGVRSGTPRGARRRSSAARS